MSDDLPLTLSDDIAKLERTVDDTILELERLRAALCREYDRGSRDAWRVVATALRSVLSRKQLEAVRAELNRSSLTFWDGQRLAVRPAGAIIDDD
jgi:hypothetical protein